MSSQPHLQLDDRAAAAKSFPCAAYAFILEGLNFAVEKVHGPPSPVHAMLAQYMAKESVDLQEVGERRESGRLDPKLCQAIDEAGGIERLNRHVSGQDLCWAVRDWAAARWGFLAPAVLATWGLHSTIDFGRLVFDLIEQGRLQKEPHDHLEDFKDVFDFQDAFDRAFRVDFAD